MNLKVCALHRQGPCDELVTITGGLKVVERTPFWFHGFRSRVVVVPAQQVLYRVVLFEESHGKDPVAIVLAPDTSRHLTDVSL